MDPDTELARMLGSTTEAEATGQFIMRAPTVRIIGWLKELIELRRAVGRKVSDDRVVSNG